MTVSRRWMLLLVIAASLTVLGTSMSETVGAERSEAAPVTVFAAASLKTALDGVTADYEASTGSKVVTSYAASSSLARQIEQGAPADIFISADLDWMDYLAGRSLIQPKSRSNLLGNRLVLIAPATASVTLRIEQGFALGETLGREKLAMADVKAVPAGKYGKVALEKLGVWPAVESKVAQAENVRTALALVARAEAALGIVYQTDALAEPKVRIVDTFPQDAHPPIVYPVAITEATRHRAAAEEFVLFLRGPMAQARFTKAGFTVLY
jgi:molybdate transport system substrate-binding protein